MTNKKQRLLELRLITQAYRDELRDYYGYLNRWYTATNKHVPDWYNGTFEDWRNDALKSLFDDIAVFSENMASLQIAYRKEKDNV